MKNKEQESSGKRKLPVVHLRGKDYVVDFALNQFREAGNSGNFIDFDSEIGEQMCGECLIIECPYCGTDQLFCDHERGRKKVCSRCGRRAEVGGR